jgi:ferrous iron transport protein B
MRGFMSCHRVFKEFPESTDFNIALAGNPNVGKSCIFNQLTGLGVVTANYPGKTVELNMGVTSHAGLKIGIIDLPGTYAISAFSDDQWVARQGILEGHPDVVVIVIDACNLQRNLYMVLQLLELGYPIVIALNLVDHAAKMGLRIDHEQLSQVLGVPIVPTVAVRGEGIDELMQRTVEIAQGKLKGTNQKIVYGRDVEQAIKSLEEAIEEQISRTPYDLPPRALAIQLLEGDPALTQMLKEGEMEGGDRGQERCRYRWRGGEGQEQQGILQLSGLLVREIEEEHGELIGVRIARERYGLAGTIADTVQTRIEKPILPSEKLKHYSVAPYTGIPFMISVLLGVFIFIFFVGGLLSQAVDGLWGSFISPPLSALIHSLVKSAILARIVLWGIDAGVLAWLSVGVPYVLTFYFVLSLLEDTGYLNSVAFLMDNVMHRLGLHGRAIIPILTGAGCNVPAIMGTRVLTTKRERILACALIVLVPCSARTAVILGSVANFVGWSYAALIYAFEVALMGLVGLGLNRVLQGESSGLVMEMFPFRVPSALTLAKKTWYRFKDFALMALPIIVLGSFALGALYETKILWMIADPIQPVVLGLLGLPAVAGIALILGVLRKELTLELLVALAIVQYGATAHNLLIFMTPLQIFIFALVVTIYIPCVATIAVLGRELGWRYALFIMAFTIALALVVGILAYRVIPYVLPLR